MEQKAYLLLENGMVFEGKAFGKIADVTGEVVFTTAMTGYLETLTDPSYYGQIVVQTFPLIGNYGVIPEDFESHKSFIKGYIVKDWCQEPSNFRSQGDLDTFLKAQGIVALYGIDTRALTKVVRESGVMNGRIMTELPEDLRQDIDALKKYEITKAVFSTTCQQAIQLPALNVREGQREKNVVLWDFGAKRNIGRELQKRGCHVTVVPAATTAAEIKAMNPDGIMLSNGPGDPAENIFVIEELKKLAEARIPTFGICLGHQLLALSQGGKTVKMKYGHRGANQPAKRMSTGGVYITSQNHGYCVVGDSLPSTAEASFVNVNDGTCEGILYKNIPAFSVQFHPEACGGPLDTGFLFDEFIEMMESGCK